MAMDALANFADIVWAMNENLVHFGDLIRAGISYAENSINLLPESLINFSRWQVTKN